MSAPREVWQCRECREKWRGSEAVSANCPTCRSTMVEKIPEPTWRRGKIALAVASLLGVAHVVLHLFSDRLHAQSNSLVRDALIWIGDHL